MVFCSGAERGLGSLYACHKPMGGKILLPSLQVGRKWDHAAWELLVSSPMVITGDRCQEWPVQTQTPGDTWCTRGGPRSPQVTENSNRGINRNRMISGSIVFEAVDRLLCPTETTAGVQWETDPDPPEHV